MKEILLSAYSEFIFNIKKGQRFSYFKRNLHFQPLKQSVDRNKQITYIEYSETSPYGHLVITTAWPKQMAMDWSAILVCENPIQTTFLNLLTLRSAWNIFYTVIHIFSMLLVRRIS